MIAGALFTAGLFVAEAWAQTTTYYAPGVPTDQPIAGDYDLVDRPRVHFSPPTKFMNDPNGLHRDPSGTWHLYYQYNPLEPVAGNQHWGHATSPDLYHWTNQPIALWPLNSTTYVFSGGAVVDANNTSGYFPDQDNGVVALYTISADGGLQTQNIAFSYDDGYTFETYAENPVINVGSDQHRDPQVIWHEPTQKWVMVVAWASEFKIEFYTSENLIDWTGVSNFTNHGLLGIQYECPNLVHMPVEGSDESMYLLFLSINPGAPLGGSVSQYFPGTFNGTHFEPVDSATRLSDYGKDNYAGQFFYGIPSNENQISIAWASNWQYTQNVPTANADSGFRSQMSLPREHYLKKSPRVGWTMINKPYNIEAIIESELAVNTSFANGSLLLDYSAVPSRALYFEANFTAPGNSSMALAGNLNFTFSSSVSGEFLRGGTVIGAQTWLDRGHTRAFSENPFFTDKFSADAVYAPDDPVADRGEPAWSLSGVIDRSIIELFTNGGELVSSSTFYAERPLDVMGLFVGGVPEGAGVSVAVWALEDTWAQGRDANGTVVGNVTSGGGNATYTGGMARLMI